MYRKKQPKSDEERFREAFQKKVSATPEQYIGRKLAAGVPAEQLQPLYDALAVEIAMKARCTALKFDVCKPSVTRESAAQWHKERAARQTVPVCPKCGGRMVRHVAAKGSRAGKAFWGCANYPMCRYTINIEDGE